MKVFVLDNYDSFTFNLVHYLEPFCKDIQVQQNDKVNLKDINTCDAILLSPGPGLPHEAGQLMNVINEYHLRKPILGVCLGLQAFVEFFGGKIGNMDQVKHGKQSACCVLNHGGIFANLPDDMMVGRYHSWAALPEDLPDCLTMTAQSSDTYVMGLKHNALPIEAVQFHPESIMTEYGKHIIKNWVKSIG